MAFEVAGQLRTFLALHVVDLRELPIPEQGVALAAVDTLNIHPQGHYYLEIGVWGGFVFEPDLDCLVGDLHHLEVVLHLLLKDRVVQDGDTRLVHRR
jgi:hypothetical protein